jgi:hypothetical protein
MNNISDIIEKIQKHRNPKYFLLNIIKNIEWVTPENFNGWLIGKKDDISYFNYDTVNYNLYYDYDKIYVILETKYHFNKVNISELVCDVVGEHFKLKINMVEFHHISYVNSKSN